MTQRTISFEWRVVENEEAWRALPPPNAVLTPSHAQRAFGSSARAARHHVEGRLLGRHIRMALILCVGLFTVTSATFVPAQQREVWAHNEVRAALQEEELAWKRNDEASYQELIDPLVHSQWQREWRIPWNIDPAARQEMGLIAADVEAWADLVRVKTLFTQPFPADWRSVPYRENRFYQQTATGWVRTLPTSAYWGEVRSLETLHLRFEFYEPDAATIIPLASRLERVYLTLYDLFDLTPPMDEPKLTLAVVPEPVRAGSAYDGRLRFTSPLLARVPQGLSDADHLAHQMVSRFTARVLNETLIVTGYSNIDGWQNLLRALRGWLRTVVLEDRSPWHQQAEAAFRTLRQAYPDLRLADINDPYPVPVSNREAEMWQYMVAESVVAYAVERYGWERLPAFVRGLGEYSYWNGLIPRTFGVSVEEFEAGWQQYLAEEYAPVDLQQLAP